MTISDRSILEFAEACGLVATRVDALGEALVTAVECIHNQQKMIGKLEDRVTFLEGFTLGQQSRIEKLIKRIEELEGDNGHIKG